MSRGLFTPLRSVTFINGATAWEGQIGRLWFGIRKPSFWRTSSPVFVRIAPEEDYTHD